MGFDTSYHPVDLRLVEDRLLPYIAGYGDDGALDDLIARAVGIRRTRFAAKQWALGALKADCGLVPALHVWGRPFFSTADTAEQVAEDVRRYLATPHHEVAALAREMLGRIDPALAGRVEPDDSGRLPGDRVLGEHLSWRMRVLRASAAALRAGRVVVRDPDTGREHDPRALLAREVPFSVVELAAALVPGWMSRGHTWPTRLCAEAGVPAAGFSPPTPLYAPLRELFPDLDWFGHATITENYAVGGFVSAADVGAVRAGLAGARGALLAPAERDGRAEGCAVDLAKIDEAMALAERLGLGFCEATEIYSGFEGNLN